MFQYIYVTAVSITSFRTNLLTLNDEVCFDFDLRATARTVYVVADAL